MGRLAAWLAIGVSAVGSPSPARAQRRTERFPTAVSGSIHPEVAAGRLDGPGGGVFDGISSPHLDADHLTKHRPQSRSGWVVAGAALAGGALGWAVGAGGTLVATRDRLAQDDLSPLLYAVIGGVAVSVPASAIAAHVSSRGHGSVLASTVLGYAIAGVAIVAWPDGGWALGPALAIPFATAVETL